MGAETEMGKISDIGLIVGITESETRDSTPGLRKMNAFVRFNLGLTQAGCGRSMARKGRGGAAQEGCSNKNYFQCPVLRSFPNSRAKQSNRQVNFVD